LGRVNVLYTNMWIWTDKAYAQHVLYSIELFEQFQMLVLSDNDLGYYSARDRTRKSVMFRVICWRFLKLNGASSPSLNLQNVFVICSTHSDFCLL